MPHITVSSKASDVPLNMQEEGSVILFCIVGEGDKGLK